MVEVSVVGDRVVFELLKSHRIWALRSRLEVPLTHITGIRADPTLTLGWLDRLKLAGAYLPGILAAGTFIEDGALVFWDVEDPARTTL